MKLHVLGSGSAGNCYLLDNGKEALVIEAGLPFKLVKQALDFDILRIKGVLITHEHLDHGKYAKEYIKARIPVYMSEGTAKALGIERGYRPINHQQAFCIHDYKVMALEATHDAAEPLLFVLNHPETGRFLFATDTNDCNYDFGVPFHNMMIECNYSTEILNQRVQQGLPYSLAKRINKNHMSYGKCKHELSNMDISQCKNIVLLHMSDGNSNAQQFQEGIQELTGINVVVAEKNVVINFNQ